MGLFNKKVPGITQYELQHRHVMQRFDEVFAHHPKSIRDRKRAELHMALGLTGDRDPNQSSAQKYGVIQRDEFNAIVDSMVHSKQWSEEEARELRAIAEKPLRT